MQATQLEESNKQLHAALEQREAELSKAEDALRSHLAGCSALASDSSEREARLMAAQAELRQQLAAAR